MTGGLLPPLFDQVPDSQWNFESDDEIPANAMVSCSEMSTESLFPISDH